MGLPCHSLGCPGPPVMHLPRNYSHRGNGDCQSHSTALQSYTAGSSNSLSRAGVEHRRWHLELQLGTGGECGGMAGVGSFSYK